MRALRVLATLGSLGAALLLLPGCSTVGFYTQAVRGHFDMMSRARPINEVIADPATPDALRSRLTLALQLREFGSRELALPDNGSYTHYADIGRAAVVWNVFAAAEFSVEARKSCFPVAGCVAYRGYFDRARADAEAARLAGAEGLQTWVGPVPAYSTLGWFDDPVLSTFVHWPEEQFARLVIHELAHQVVYLRGDTTFNESYAVAVEREGVRRWLAYRGDRERAQAFARSQAWRAEFLRMLLDHRTALAALYRLPLEPAQMRERRDTMRERLREDYRAFRARWAENDLPFAALDRWFGDGPNNAQLASVAVYNELVPAFEALLARVGGHLAAFHAEVAALARLPKAERAAQLRELAAALPH